MPTNAKNDDQGAVTGTSGTDTTDNDTRTATSGGDAGQAEVQRTFDEAAEKGYFGTVPPQPPNEAFSLESGPDSPSVEELRNWKG